VRCQVKDTESAILVNATIDTQSESHAIFAAESEIHEIVAVMAVMVVRCEISGWTTPLPEEGINIQAWQHAMMRHIVACAWKDMLLPMLKEDHLLGSASHFYFPSVSSIHLI
jgi:hypothetical protein